MDYEPHPHPYFDDLRFGQAESICFSENAADTTAPLLYQVQFPENTGNNVVTDPGYALQHVFNRQARKQDSGILFHKL